MRKRSNARAPVSIDLLGAGRFRDVDRRLGRWLEQVASSIAPDGSTLSATFLGDARMRQLNLEHRGIDRTTDVLSFEGSTTPEGRHLGDIVVSVPYARRQAADRGHGVAAELRVLLLHGLLHCLGHDHETDGGRMERIESRLRRKWIPGARSARSAG